MKGVIRAVLGFEALSQHLVDGAQREVARIIPPEQRLYSWWSYRARDWALSDRGRRLDHVWLSPALSPGLRDASVLREARGWVQPSDHVPVSVDLEL